MPGDRRVLRRAVEARRELRAVLAAAPSPSAGSSSRSPPPAPAACRPPSAARRRRASCGGMRAKSGGSALLATKVHGPVSAGDAEPAARRAARSSCCWRCRSKHVAGRVRRPQQLRADDGHEVGLAVEDDQLGRHLAGDRSSARRWRATASGWPWARRRAGRPTPVFASSCAMRSSRSPSGPRLACVHGPVDRVRPTASRRRRGCRTCRRSRPAGSARGC